MHFLKTDRILVVAPHPDDEAIGCGGLLAKYGPQCDILVLADGRKGYPSALPVDEDALVQTRKQELQRSAAIAGVHQLFFLDIPDGTVGENRSKVAAFDLSGYNAILVPNHRERHKDHSAAAALIHRMRRRQNPRAKLFEYEVWSPLAAPSHVLNISDVIDTKLEMVSQHQSQLQYVDYRAMTLGLSQYRGAGFSAQYCEVYRYIPFRNALQRLYDHLPAGIYHFLHRIRHADAATRKE